MFYIESNGFAATTWLANALSSVDGMHCFHSSRAIPESRPLGSKQDLSEEEFVNRLSDLENQDGIDHGAVHCKYPFSIKQHIVNNNGVYALAVREPLARIDSCYAWAQNKVKKNQYFDLSKDVLTLAHVACGDNTTLKDLLYSFSIFHVVNFDFATFSNIELFDDVFRMEDYTKDADYFSNMVKMLSNGRIAIDSNLSKMIFSDQSKKNSHTGKVFTSSQERYDSLDESCKTMLVNVFVSNNLKSMYGEWGYTCEWI